MDPSLIGPLADLNLHSPNAARDRCADSQPCCNITVKGFMSSLPWGLAHLLHPSHSTWATPAMGRMVNGSADTM